MDHSFPLWFLHTVNKQYAQVQITNYIHLCTDRLLPRLAVAKLWLFYRWLASLPYKVRYATHTNEWLMRLYQICDWNCFAAICQLPAVSIWNFVSRRVSLSLWLAGIWCVPTVQLYSFLSSFQPQWPHPPLLLNKLSGSWKTSSPVVSVSTPTLNQNCCSVSMCFANNVWSDL